MKRTVSTQSLIEVKVRVPTGTYGAECTMEQILKQARQEGLQLVRSLVHNKGVVVGEPRVLTITTEEGE